MNVAIEIDKFKKELNKIIVDLESINDENFDIINNSVYNSVANIKKLRENLLNKYPVSELKKYNAELGIPIKVINKLFDNIVDKKKKEQQKVLEELKAFDNKKKLTKYIR